MFDIRFSSVDLTGYQENIAFTSNFAGHEWYVDSSATNHIIVDMNNLTIKVDYIGNEKLMVGNGSKLVISHFGNSFLPYKNSFKPVLLNNILHVPLITKNLFNIS